MIVDGLRRCSNNQVSYLLQLKVSIYYHIHRIYYRCKLNYKKCYVEYSANFLIKGQPRAETRQEHNYVPNICKLVYVAMGNNGRKGTRRILPSSKEILWRNGN